MSAAWTRSGASEASTYRFPAATSLIAFSNWVGDASLFTKPRALAWAARRRTPGLHEVARTSSSHFCPVGWTGNREDPGQSASTTQRSGRNERAWLGAFSQQAAVASMPSACSNSAVRADRINHMSCTNSTRVTFASLRQEVPKLAPRTPMPTRLGRSDGSAFGQLRVSLARAAGPASTGRGRLPLCLVLPSPGRTRRPPREQGTAPGLRLVFHAAVDGVQVAATSADVLGTEPDVEQAARRRLWPVPAGGHRLADVVTRPRRTQVLDRFKRCAPGPGRGPAHSVPSAEP
jgi:hypothetical protein